MIVGISLLNTYWKVVIIMSTPEYIQYLRDLKSQILRNLNDFTMGHDDYQNEVNRLSVIDKELAIYGLA